MINLLIGLLVGAFVTYVLLKLVSFQKQLIGVSNSFPSPEEVAREVVRVKLPISEIPKEMVGQIKENNLKEGKSMGYVG